MTAFKQFLHKIFSGLETQEELDEDYLAQAVDTCDLERRIHELEHRGAGCDDFPLHAAIPGLHSRRASW